jgi:hypothetical protein
MKTYTVMALLALTACGASSPTQVQDDPGRATLGDGLVEAQGRREAVRIVVYYRLSRQAHEEAWEGAGWIEVPLKRTARIRLEGRDAEGNPAPLSSQTVCAGFGCVGTTRFHVIDNEDATWTLVPDSVGFPDANLTARANRTLLAVPEIHVVN